MQQRFPQAEAAVRESLALAPDNAIAHEMLGDIHIALKRGADAYASFREALRPLLELKSSDPAPEVRHAAAGALRRLQPR